MFCLPIAALLGHLGLLFTLPGMVIGQTLLALPIVVSWTAQAVEGQDMRLAPDPAHPWRLTRPARLADNQEARYEIGMVCATAFGRVVTGSGGGHDALAAISAIPQEP